MGRIIFTDDERARIEQILEELDPARHELTRHYRDRLSAAEWDFVWRYIRNELRGLLELTTLALTLAEEAAARGLANDDGINDFLGSRTWVRNFDIADPQDDRFIAIAKGLGRSADTSNYDLVIDADTLMEIAQERMKGTLEEEYVELLRELGPDRP